MPETYDPHSCPACGHLWSEGSHRSCVDEDDGPPEHFMRDEDGYARMMAWEAGNRAEQPES